MASRDYMIQPIAMAKVNRSKGGPTDVPPTEIGSHAGMATMNLGSSVIYAANEPSLALYRVQEHIRKSVPTLVERRLVSEDITEKVKGAIFDAEYSIDAVKAASTSLDIFKGINEKLKHSVHAAQRIKYAQTRNPSMYEGARKSPG